MGDVDPTGDRTWRGDDDTMPEFFYDLRHEVDLAARRYAELSTHADELVAERDRLRDEVDAVRRQYESHIGTLNAGIHGLERMLADTEADRDRLRAVVAGCPRCAQRVAITPESLGSDEPFPPAQLDGSPTMGDQPDPAAACCGDALFWCPTVEQIECEIHGGFSTCCEHPERHVTISRLVEGVIGTPNTGGAL